MIVYRGVGNEFYSNLKNISSYREEQVNVIM